MLTEKDADEVLAESQQLHSSRELAQNDADVVAFEIAYAISRLSWATIKAALMAESRGGVAAGEIRKLLDMNKTLTDAAAGKGFNPFTTEPPPAPAPAAAEDVAAPFNEFLVGVQDPDTIMFSTGIASNATQRGVVIVSRDRALGLAAWLVALADPDCTKFSKILAAVLNT